MLPQSVQNNKKYLKKRSDYLKTYKGKAIRREILTLFARANGAGYHRLGYTITKSIGSAVTRNRFKRWCREIYRVADLAGLPKSMDLNVFVGSKKKPQKEDYRNVTFGEFEKQLRSAFGSLI